MAVQTTLVNKPLNPRGNDQSPLAYNRAKLFSGKALDFDGVNDILTMPTALTSSLSTTSVTFVTNVKTDFATWVGTRDDAFSFAERGVILAFNGGNIYYYYRHQSSGWRNLQVPNADFKPQEWNQMVTTIDLNANTWKAYVNGIEVATSGTYSDTAIAYESNALTIGAQTGARFFDGQIAGFKIFNTALTAAQVADLYNNPEKVVPTGVDNTALKLWLPMQEGAGTTAYDGSGNGNHGTISGATYTHGIGAPVAQTAVIDWNKGSNLLLQSNDFTTSWTGNSVSLTTGQLGPTGINDAWKLEKVAAYGNIVQGISVNNASTYTFSIIAKAGNTDFVSIRFSTGSGYDYRHKIDLTDGTTSTASGDDSSGVVYKTQNLGDGWWRFGIVCTTNSTTAFVNAYAGDTADASGYVYIAHAHAQETNELKPYIRTYASTLSNVLLPQGLTSGRDITGVNLFENVRKQGALNLDGNSWAEVHDNASLDITDEVTLECWFDNTNAYDSIRYLFDKSNGATNGFEFRLTSQNGVQLVFRNLSTISKVATIPTSGWVHVVGVYDGSSIIIYVNGVFGASVASTGSIGANDDVLTIGGDNTFTPYSLNKPIAQPRIYNRALTAEEVQRNYNAGKNIYTNS